MATEPAASPTVPVLAHLKLVLPVPMGGDGTRPHHMVFYVAGCGTLQGSWVLRGWILSIGRINVSVIREIFFTTRPETP